MAGKKQQAGFKTSLDPHREGSTDIRAKLLHGHRDWKLIRFRELITECRHFTEQIQKSSKDGWTAADERRARGHVNERTAEINSLWRDLSAQFERAVLDGNADWFERQAKAIRSGDTRDKTKKARGRFEAEVARVLEMSSHRKRAEEEKENPNMEAMTLEPAGKQTGVTAQQILDKLDQRKEGRYLMVEGCRFLDSRRAREAITKIAKLHRYVMAD